MTKDELLAEFENRREQLAKQGIVDTEALAELLARLGEPAQGMILNALRRPTGWGLSFDGGTQEERLYYRAFGREGFIATREQVKQYSKQLQDRRIRPEQFAFFLAGVPEKDRGKILRIAAGEAPGLVGDALDGTAHPHQDNLLRASFMSDEEFRQYQQDSGLGRSE